MPQVAGLIVLAVVFSSFLFWWQYLLPRSPFRIWLAAQTGSPVPWGLVDLLLALMLWLVVNMALALTSQWALDLPRDVESLETLPPSRQVPLLWFHSAGTLAICGLIALLLWLRHRVTSRDLGWSRADLVNDILLGARAFAMVAPVVYAIQLVLTQFVESHHPLIELLKAHPDPGYFGAAAFMAVLVAPLAEEFLFRVLLQGWLERAFRAPAWGDELVHGGGVISPVPALPQESSVAPDPADDREVAPEASRPIVWRPILVSSFCFALAHWNHGPDPIPLFALAVGLGYLYQRTGRLAPCVVLHLLLNLFSLGALWVAVQSPGS